jgi:U3 small nucleolar RNA-associated protein 10
VRREALTSDENARLDAQIARFLRLLSPHFLEPACFQVLEYLVRRYKAHERCVGAMLACGLPYHSSSEFPRLVSALALPNAASLGGGGQRSPFLFLQRMQETGAPAPRELLAQRCSRDASLLRWVCATAAEHGEARGAAARREEAEAEADEAAAEAEAVAAGGDVEAAVAASAAARRRRAAAAAQAQADDGDDAKAARQPAGSRAFLSFYAALLCDVIALSPKAADPGPNGLAALLLPYLADGMSASSASADYRAATLMAVTSLAGRCALGGEFLAGESFCCCSLAPRFFFRARAPWMNTFFIAGDGIFSLEAPRERPTFSLYSLRRRQRDERDEKQNARRRLCFFRTPSLSLCPFSR